MSPHSRQRQSNLSPTSTAILLHALLFATACSASSVQWLYPQPDAPTFNVLDTVWLRWNSGFPNPSLNLWCVNKDTTPHTFEPPLGIKPWNISASGTYPLQLHFGTEFKGPCHVGFYPNNSSPSIGNSPNFFVDFRFHAKPRTWGREGRGGASLAGASSRQPLAAEHDPDRHDGQPETHGDDGGLSTGAKVGIGVGVTLGVLIVGGLVVAFLLVRRRRRRAGQGQGQVQEQEQGQSSSVFSRAELVEGTTALGPLPPAAAQREKPVVEPPQESGGHEIAELDGTMINELHSDDSPVAHV